jgi:hypothetical protein
MENDFLYFFILCILLFCSPVVDIKMKYVIFLNIQKTFQSTIYIYHSSLSSALPPNIFRSQELNGENTSSFQVQIKNGVKEIYFNEAEFVRFFNLSFVH